MKPWNFGSSSYGDPDEPVFAPKPCTISWPITLGGLNRKVVDIFFGEGTHDQIYYGTDIERWEGEGGSCYDVR